MDENSNPIPLKSNFEVRKWLLYILAAVLIFAAIFIIYIYFFPKKNVDVTQNPSEEPKKETSSIDEILPKGAKTPEEFLEKVNEKSKELQKEYDSNLTIIAQKKWENIFLAVNKLPEEYLSDHISIENSTVTKDPDGTNSFEIKYKIKVGWAEAEANDSFFLITSEEKTKALGLGEDKANIFFTEKEIEDNLAKDGFGIITRIKAKDTVSFSSFEDSISALSQYVKTTPQEVHIVAGSEKTIHNGTVPVDDLYVLGKYQVGDKCQVSFISLFDSNNKGTVDCVN